MSSVSEPSVARRTASHARFFRRNCFMHDPGRARAFFSVGHVGQGVVQMRKVAGLRKQLQPAARAPATITDSGLPEKDVATGRGSEHLE
jgi:hypothetical protein